jgi:hypothetical protein
VTKGRRSSGRGKGLAVPGAITYYAVIADNRTIDNPYGLVRRLEHDDGPSDEGMRQDFSWVVSPLIAEWERGGLGHELVEVSHTQASKIIEWFRVQWGSYGEPLDP